MRIKAGWACFRVSALCALLAGAFMALAVPQARASVVLNVGGTGDGGATISDGQAIAISFDVTANLPNFTLSAPLTCVVGPCTGSVWLQRTSLGPGTTAQTMFADTLSNLLSGNVISLSSSSIGVNSSPLGGLTPDLYILIVALEDDNNSQTPPHSLVWTGSTTAVVSQDPAPPNHLASRSLEYRYDPPPTIDAWVPLSNFAAIAAESPNLHFTLNSELSTTPPPQGVPEPASLALLLTAFGLGALTRRRMG